MGKSLNVGPNNDKGRNVGVLGCWLLKAENVAECHGWDSHQGMEVAAFDDLEGRREGRRRVESSGAADIAVLLQEKERAALPGG